MAKKYNTRFKLTWFAPANCWKKYRNGKTYYLGKGQCKGKGDLDGYHAALREWVQVLADVVAVPESHSESLYTGSRILDRDTNVFATNYGSLGKAVGVPAHSVCKLPGDVPGLVNAFLAEHRTLAEKNQNCLGQYVTVPESAGLLGLVV